MYVYKVEICRPATADAAETSYHSQKGAALAAAREGSHPMPASPYDRSEDPAMLPCSAVVVQIQLPAPTRITLLAILNGRPDWYLDAHQIAEFSDGQLISEARISRW
jgi:hypothetical protein